MSDNRKVRPAGERRRQRRRRCDSTATHFFRIMLPSIIQEQKLRIPKKFITRFGDELSAVATLAVPNGSAWNVTLEKVKKKVYFKDGWDEFVRHHSIEEYYFLVFNYRGNSGFDVVIFDPSTTEICYDQEPSHAKGCPSHHEEELEDDDDDDDDHDSIEILGSSPPSCFVPKSSEKKDDDDDDDDDDSIEILSSSPPPRCVPKSSEKKDDDDNDDEDYSIEILSSSTPPCSVPKFMKKKKRALGGCSNPPPPKNLGTNTCAESCLGVEKHGRNANLKNQEIKLEYMTRTKRSKVDNLNESSPGNLNIEMGPDQFKKKKPKIEPTEDEQPARNGKEDESLSTKILSKCFSMKKPKMIQRREEAIKAANMYKPQSPSFMAILRPYNIVRGGFVNVPTDFARKCLMHFPEFIKLRQQSDGREWCVQCIHYDVKRWTMNRGWPVFVQENDLEEGDVCVFELIQGTEIVLKVTIFRKRTLGVEKHGQNAAPLKNQEPKREYLTRTKRSKMDHLNESSPGNLNIVIGPDQFKKKKTKIEPTEDEQPERRNGLEDESFSTKILSRRFSMKKPKMTQRREEAIKAASMYKPQSPSFMAILRPYNVVRSGFVNVPTDFARKCLMQFPEFIKKKCLMRFPEFIKLRHQSDGREWCVRCPHYDVKRWTMTKGWAGFVQENDLEEGDVCVFELIQGSEIVLKVTIFRKRTLGVEKHGQNAASLKNKKLKRKYLTRTKRSKMEHLNESSQGNLKIEMDPDQFKKKKPKSEPNEDDQLARIGKEVDSFGTEYILRGSSTKKFEMIQKREEAIGSSTKKFEMIQKREEAIKAASMFKPENPTFMKIMRSYSIRMGTVYVAADFARKLPMKVSKFIKLRDLGGREWCVRCIPVGHTKGLVISKGWPVFVRENDLEEGDVCVFELIQSTEIVFKVTIFRANEDGGS